MKIAVSEAKGQLTELVRRAEAGEEVVLTRHGNPAVQLVPLKPKHDPARRRAVLDAICAVAAAKASAGPEAVRSQDHLYDESGMPA